MPPAKITSKQNASVDIFHSFLGTLHKLIKAVMIIYIVIGSNIRMTNMKLLMNLLRLLEMPCLELASATESSSISIYVF